MFGRATITLGIGPYSSFDCFASVSTSCLSGLTCVVFACLCLCVCVSVLRVCVVGCLLFFFIFCLPSW